jgi:hypothetical protein
VRYWINPTRQCRILSSRNRLKAIRFATPTGYFPAYSA